LPDYTVTTPGPTFSGAQEIFLIFVSVGLYVAFVLLQTSRHRAYFTLGEAAGEETAPAGGSIRWHAALLLAYIFPVVYLAEKLAAPIDSSWKLCAPQPHWAG
jgi:Ca2+:H+ antiporter